MNDSTSTAWADTDVTEHWWWNKKQLEWKKKTIKENEIQIIWNVHLVVISDLMHNVVNEAALIKLQEVLLKRKGYALFTPSLVSII